MHCALIKGIFTKKIMLPNRQTDGQNMYRRDAYRSEESSLKNQTIILNSIWENHVSQNVAYGRKDLIKTKNDMKRGKHVLFQW